MPPIILYAGLSVRKKAFFKNAPTIASTGILGTYMAFAIIAVLLYSIRKAVDIKLSVSTLQAMSYALYSSSSNMQTS